MKLLSVFSLLALSACMSVERPDAYAWGVNGPKQRLEGFNIKHDYDSNGVRLPGAQMTVKPLANGLNSLNGAICFLPPKANSQPYDEGIKGMKVWLGDLRDWAKEHCQ